MVKTERVYKLKECKDIDGPVVYWMSRDQRVEDNWALLYAQELSLQINHPLAVIFCISPSYPGANIRHYDFMIKGLREVSKGLKNKNIPFYLLTGDVSQSITEFIYQNEIKHVVTDFDPLRIKLKWKNELLKTEGLSVYEVDAHNIVPCRQASPKCEFGAYTLRPKITKLLPFFVDEFPSLETQRKTGNFLHSEINWKSSLEFPAANSSVLPVKGLIPGAIEANKVFGHFLDHKINSYNIGRNDPTEGATSNLSPYLHFGQISAQRIAIEIMKKISGDQNSMSFLEELIVRRELSDNFCFYNSDYDKVEGFPAWARETLDEHRMDEREYLYDFDKFEAARTHDRLWNAAQMEMVKTGKMHGYMRMYWSKKILEWTRSPEEALDFAIRLNDCYQLDGRDPNGYVGCAWSIGGVHDRAWAERPVYGKIRYMNYNGCKRKFDVEKYIHNWL